MIAVVLIFLLILFSVIWLLVWSWFFKSERSSDERFNKAAKKAFEDGNFKKAKELFLQSSNLNSDTEANYQLGVSRMELKEYKEAKECFEKVLKVEPKNIGALNNLAKLLKQEKKFDEALELYNKAATEKGDDIECQLNIGDIYYEKGEYDKALEFFEKAKAIDPENVQALFYLTKCKTELNASENDDVYQQGIEELTKLKDQENLPSDYHITMAKMHAKSGQLEEAISSCRKALELKDQDIEAYKLLGLIQLIKNDLSGSKNSLSIAINLQPNNQEIHEIFSYLLCMQEDDCQKENCRKKYFELIKKYLK